MNIEAENVTQAPEIEITSVTTTHQMISKDCRISKAKI